MTEKNEAALKEIKSRWKDFYPADGSGKGIICPICGSGSGKNGTGISAAPNTDYLTCWKCAGTANGFHGGDVLDLMQAAGSYGAQPINGFTDAFKAAAAELNIQIDTETPNNAPQRTQTAFSLQTDKTTTENKKTPQNATQSVTGQIPRDYTAFYNECSNNINAKRARDYLQKRGISNETAAAFNLGYCSTWTSPTHIERKKAAGEKRTMKPSERLIIPVSRNHYIARAIDEKTPKEYSKVNETGHGKTGIFNLKALYEDAAENGVVFVTEGAFDALSVAEAGETAIALNSVANTKLLLRKLQERPTTATLILCLDNDEAGKSAIEFLQDGLKRLNISYTIADICCGCKDPNEALVKDRVQFVDAITRAQCGNKALKPDNVTNYIDNLMRAEIDELKAAADVKTGFAQLDKQCGGIYQGLYVIAAISSLGKTTFVGQIADNFAAAGNEVLFFSLEQSTLEIVSKSLSRMSSAGQSVFTSLQIRKGLESHAVQQAKADYIKGVADHLSVIEGNMNCTVDFIADYTRRYIERTKAKPIVIIDYLQILQPAAESRYKSSKETADATITALKRLSRECKITIIAISSVNRSNYLLPIDFESLKESGCIEYTADVVLGLQLHCVGTEDFQSMGTAEKRKAVQLAKTAEPRKIELVCLKNRYGISSFTCDFEYYPAKDLFIEADFKQQEAAKSRKRI